MLKQILVSDAFAQTSEAASNQDFSFTSFVPLLLIFGVFYFLIIRPQSKKYKEHQEMVNNLKIGNKVITSGGIIGVVKDIDNKENLVKIEVSNGVVVEILKNYVSELVIKNKDKTKNKS